MATNVNKNFGIMWLYIILAILGAASAIFGLVTLFTEPGNDPPQDRRTHRRDARNMVGGKESDRKRQGIANHAPPAGGALNVDEQ